MASRELSFALDVCRQAGEVALRHLQQGVTAQMKADETPVTVADQECERLIRESLARTFPSDDVLGEEEGASNTSAALRKWIIDPIDGTYNYMRGIPIFATLLALEQSGEVVLGVVHAPALNETYWAERGGGAYKNGDRIHASGVQELASAQLNFGTPKRILQAGYWESFSELVTLTYRQRGFGDYLGFAHVFDGRAEAMIEIGVKPWDLAPMKIIAQESGGLFSDLDGGSSIYKGDCLVSNAAVHEPILKVLAKNRGGNGHK